LVQKPNFSLESDGNKEVWSKIPIPMFSAQLSNQLLPVPSGSGCDLNQLRKRFSAPLVFDQRGVCALPVFGG
jgi:hypothetical protein